MRPDRPVPVHGSKAGNNAVGADGRKRVGVLASGNGSNLQALIDACADPSFPARIVLLICNRPGARAIARADAAGIPTAVIPHRDFADRASFDAALDTALVVASCDIVCLAGFMRILTSDFVERWSDRMLNIHPSLLPAFRGLDTHRRALAANVRKAGCTVHLVTPDLDAGPCILQAHVNIRDGDTPERLAARVLEQEHKIYPVALRLFAEERAIVEAGKVTILNSDGQVEAVMEQNFRLGGTIVGDL